MTWQPPSEEEFNATWLTPEEALDIAPTYDDATRQRWIIERLKTGLIVAVARTGVPRGSLEKFVPVTPGHWRTWDDYGEEHFWVTGDASFTIGDITGYGDGITVRFQDVRFDPTSFSGKPPRPAPPEQELSEPAPTAAAANTSVPRNLGGRPAKAWWEDLWVEMCRQLYCGDLKPDRQADIERAMLDWVAEQGETASEMTIRTRARKLFNALMREG